MADWFFDFFPLENVVLTILFFFAFGAYFRWKFEDVVQSKIQKLEDQVDDLSSELCNLKSEQELLQRYLEKLENDLIPDDEKIRRLVDMGFPPEIATEAVVCGEVGGHKIR